MKFRKILIISTVLCFLTNICFVMAYDMSSENYKLQIEGIDMGAIGEMRDFFNTNKNFPLASALKEFFFSRFSWKMALVFFAGFLTVSFLSYLIIKRMFLPKR